MGSRTPSATAGRGCTRTGMPSTATTKHVPVVSAKRSALRRARRKAASAPSAVESARIFPFSALMTSSSVQKYRLGARVVVVKPFVDQRLVQSLEVLSPGDESAPHHVFGNTMAPLKDALGHARQGHLW